MGGNNILELEHKCQNTIQGESFTEMLDREWTESHEGIMQRKEKIQIHYSQYILANYFENEAGNYIVILMISNQWQ